MTKPIVELDLYLARHGESRSNADDLAGRDVSALSVSERHDPHLSKIGERQAKLLGERFAEVAFDAVWSSALIRAVQTAAEVVRRQPENGAKEIVILPALTERGTSKELEGLSFTKLKEEFGCLVPARGVDVEASLIIGNDNEDEEAQVERATAVLNAIREKYHDGERVLISGHGCINTSVLLLALGLDNNQIFDPEFVNTGVTRVLFFKKGTGPYGFDVRLCFHNDMTHLAAEYPQLLIGVN